MCFSRANMQTITLVTKFVGRTHGQNAQFQIELRPRKGYKGHNNSVEVCAIVRRLQSMELWVVADLIWNTERSALFFYNKVSKDFANWMKTITNIIILTLKT